MKEYRLKKGILASILIIASLLMSCSGPSEERLFADLVVINANIITVDDENPRAEALAVKDGRFVAVGPASRIKSLIGRDTKVIDALGKTVTPGFIDAHMHPRPIYPVTSRLGKVDLSPNSVKTMDDLINALKEKAKITPKGHWVEGSRYQDTKLGRHPTRWDLDKASTEHPIYISHSSGHISAVNSKALEIAKIAKDIPDPAGGAFDRDKDGEPTGVCRETATRAFLNVGFQPPSPTREGKLEGILLCFKSFLSQGITSVVDAGANPSKIRLYQDALEAGQPVRVNMMIRYRYLPDLKKLNLRTGFGNERLKIGAIKTGHGNSLSGRTCWLYEPYDIINPKTGKKDYYGIPPRRSQAELDSMIFEIHEAEFQAAVHSNGDREIDMVLSAFEKALKKLPRKDHRHRIEHASVVNPSILKKAKDLGIILALHSYVYEHGDKMEAYGEKRWGMMHANRSALDLRIPIAGNSDYAVSAADPMLRIQSMVTRKSEEGKVYGPEQRVSVEEAISIWTLESAYASFEEDVKGSIEAGKLADFVILDQDPTKVPPETIQDINVEKTIIGGKIKYERAD
ncbi:amidohydrolase [Acidobacteria bacterium AH-259-A15]|nr:amidohydrolase [Acidobacteria bacterium AH-259-A15]